MARIFLDCSNLRLDQLPTGVPRVVANYIAWGTKWAEANGHELIPVVPQAEGLLPAYHSVARDPRRLLVRLPKPQGPAERLYTVRVVLNYVLDRIRLISFHCGMTIGLLLPLPHRMVERAASAMSFLVTKPLAALAVAMKSWYERASRIPVRDGDILFCPSYWHDVESAVYLSLHQAGCRIHFLIHDILPVTHPEHYSFPWRDEFKERLLASFSFVEEYSCVSDYTRRSLLDFAAQAGVHGVRARVVHNGLDPLSPTGEANMSEEVKDVLEDMSEFLIMVGSIEPKKNHIYVLDQLSAMWARGYRTPLLIVGRRGWMDHNVVDRIARHPLLGKKLFWLDQVTDVELAVLYRRARFLVFASEAEGFGLPLIEALSHGLPVAVFDTPIAREVAGDCGLYFDRAQSQLADVLQAYDDDRAYQALRRKLLDFQWPSWKETAEQLFEALTSSARREAVGPPLACPAALPVTRAA